MKFCYLRQHRWYQVRQARTTIATRHSGVNSLLQLRGEWWGDQVLGESCSVGESQLDASMKFCCGWRIGSVDKGACQSSEPTCWKERANTHKHSSATHTPIQIHIHAQQIITFYVLLCLWTMAYYRSQRCSLCANKQEGRRTLILPWRNDQCLRGLNMFNLI